MTWSDLPQFVHLVIVGSVAGCVTILLIVLMCQCVWLYTGRKHKDSGSGYDRTKERFRDRDYKDKRVLSPSRQSQMSASSSGSEDYGSIMNTQNRTKQDNSTTETELQENLQYLQIPEIIHLPGTLGSLHFSVCHEKERDLIVVKVTSANDLRKRPFGGNPNPYLEVELRKRNLEEPEMIFRTDVRTKTLNPTFDRTFEAPFPMSHLAEYTLRFVVYDHRRFGQRDLLGQAEMNLITVNWIRDVSQEIVLEPGTERQRPLGELLVSLCYLPTSERVHVAVLGATGFAAAKDPFVRVCLLLGAKKLSKRRVASSRQLPGLVFHETLYFEVPRDKMGRVRILIVAVGAAQDQAAEGATAREHELGDILIGRHCSYNAHAHWNEMIRLARIPIVQWYQFFQKYDSTGTFK